MALYKNKYRIESTRLKEWDYSNPWYYYVTINTNNHIHFFGKVTKDKMILNELGKIVEIFWKEIPNHYPNVKLDYFVVMPNHIHGIIIIDTNVETRHASSLRKKELISLSDVIGSFKSVVSKYAHSVEQNNFHWQPRFYDRIIRNDKELYNIRKYIEENPLRWGLEKDLPGNINIM